MTTGRYIKNAWVTLNRACNLRCRWCYAAKTGYRAADDMPFELFCEIVDLVSELGVKSVTLTGGEPTIYPQILEAIRYCKDHSLDVNLPTNGLVFASRERVEEYSAIGVNAVGMSVKAHDRQSHIDATGIDCFDDVVGAIQNLSQQDRMKFMIVTVVTSDNKDHVADVLRMAKGAGASLFGLQAYRGFGCPDGSGERYCRSDIQKNVVELADYFASHVEELSAITENRILVDYALPQCLWPKEFANMLDEHHWLKGPCQLHRHDGLIFDTAGYVLPCNAMPDIRLGRIREDFSDRESFWAFWSSRKVEDAFSAWNQVPDERCNSCDRYEKCRGGCVSNWLNYSFDDIRGYLPKD